MARLFLFIFLTFGFLSLAAGQDEAKKVTDDVKNVVKLLSGPQKGEILPGPCEVLNFNGRGKDRYHCPVCEFGPDPVLLVFVHEPDSDDPYSSWLFQKNSTLNMLIERMEGAAKEHQEFKFHGVVIFLSDAAIKPAAEPASDDSGKLVEEKLVVEGKKRIELYDRLKARASERNAVIVACTTAKGPEKYNINPKAEITMVFYRELKVLENYVFAEDEMAEADVEKIMKKIEETFKKRPAKKVKD